jgi:F0F1-type ATP synthase epsilon subunit
MNKFKFQLIGIDGLFLEKEIEALICQTDLGEISILANHHPIIAVVNKGKIKIQNENKSEEIEILNNCILEFSENTAKLLEMF